MLVVGFCFQNQIFTFCLDNKCNIIRIQIISIKTPIYWFRDSEFKSYFKIYIYISKNRYHPTIFQTKNNLFFAKNKHSNNTSESKFYFGHMCRHEFLHYILFKIVKFRVENEGFQNLLWIQLEKDLWFDSNWLVCLSSRYATEKVVNMCEIPDASDCFLLDAKFVGRIKSIKEFEVDRIWRTFVR